MKRIIFTVLGLFLLFPINASASVPSVSFGYVPVVSKYDNFDLLFYVENLSCLNGYISFDPDIFYNGGYTYGNGWSDFLPYPAGTITIDSCCDTCTSKAIIEKTEMYNIQLWVKASARTFPSSTITFTPIYAEDINGNSVEVNSLSAITRQLNYSNPGATLSPNNNLLSLTIAEGELDPVFNKNILEYDVTIPYSVKQVNIVPKVENYLAQYKIVGDKEFRVGLNVVTVVVTAQNGTTKNYKINITRKPINSNNNLKSLVTEVFSLNEEFDKNIQEYTVTVPYKNTKLIFAAIAEDDGTVIDIIGNNNFVVGDNEVLVKVTSEDGHIKQYKIIATRMESSSNNNLKNIKINELNKTINIRENKNDYSVTVDKDIDVVTLTAMRADENAIIKLEDSYSLKQLNNKIIIEVVAENGDAKNYTITINNKENKVPVFIDLGLPIITIIIFMVFYISINREKISRLLKGRRK